MEQLTTLNIKNTLTSMEVAEMIERPHNEMLKTIRQYADYLAEGKIPQGEYFAESSYIDANNQKRPCYLISKKGCELIANKITGSKGVQFTAKYVERFNNMEQSLLSSMSPELQAIIMQDKKLSDHDERIKVLEDTKYISPKQKKDITKKINQLVSDACGGKNKPAYKEMSKKLYSNINHKIFEKYGVSQRAEIPYIKFDEAMDFVNGWYPDYELAVQIENLNKGNGNAGN